MTTQRLSIRVAMRTDIASLVELDPIAKNDPERKAFIESSVAAVQCWVATRSDDSLSCVGYGVLDRTFFGQYFVPLVMVEEASRSRGIGTAILRELVAHCRGAKVFTSTNASNTTMRALLLKCGFIESGYIDNLDEGDPELIFVKRAIA